MKFREDELLTHIKSFINKKHYRVTIHAVRHMIEEGFSEKDMISAITGISKIIELYPEDNRCLVLGYFHWSANAKSPLHVVCEYSNKKIIDIVTAYIPQKPWWFSPIKRGKKR